MDLSNESTQKQWNAAMEKLDTSGCEDGLPVAEAELFLKRELTGDESNVIDIRIYPHDDPPKKCFCAPVIIDHNLPLRNPPFHWLILAARGVQEEAES